MFRFGAFAFEVVHLEIRVLDLSAWSSVLMRRHSPPPEQEFVFRARTAGRLGAATDGGAQKDFCLQACICTRDDRKATRCFSVNCFSGRGLRTVHLDRRRGIRVV